MSSVVGTTVFLRGTLRALQHPGPFLKGLAITGVLLVLCLIGLGYGADALADYVVGTSDGSGFWLRTLAWLTWLALFAAGLTLVPLALSLLVAVVSPAVTGQLFERVAGAADNRRRGSQPALSRSELSIAQVIRIEVWRLAFALVGSAILAVVGFFAGIPLWGATQTLFGGWCLGVEMLGLHHERHGRNRQKQDAFNTQHRGLVLGVGVVSLMIYAIPGLQLAAPMLTTAGAAELSAWIDYRGVD